MSLRAAQLAAIQAVLDSCEAQNARAILAAVEDASAEDVKEKAAEDLDRAVALEVLGWRPEFEHEHGGYFPRFSADWNHVRCVVERILEKHTLQLSAIPGESIVKWVAEIGFVPLIEKKSMSVCAPTAELAICRVAVDASRAGRL